MKSKRATAASTEDSNPVDVSIDKKRKRTDDDAISSSSLKKHKEDIKEKREKKKEKKEKKEKKKEAKEEREAKKPKKDKSKYNNKTRKEKKDERKNIQDLPEDMDSDESGEGGAQIAEPAVTQPEAKTNGDAKKEKKEKKDKKEKKKAEKEAQPQPETSASKDVPQGEDAIDLDASTAAKPGRNIVFVGNLPYTATAATITAHFASLKPVAVRCLTKKEDPKMSRGIAFVEFSSPAHQRTCLDKFHHSMFEDGVSEPRRINVELTAGGGGKSQGRQGKIMEKNKKLDENRAKRIEKEKTTKEENQGNGGNARMDIHPSRLARLPGFQG